MKCVSANEILCWLGIEFSTDCERSVCKVNSILRRHYANLVLSKTTEKAIWFTWANEITTNTDNWEDIYRVNWVFVKVTDCCTPWPCLTKVKSCDNYECDYWYQLSIKDALWELEPGCYTVDCDKISINVGAEVERGYITYSKWPKEITSMDEEICIDPLEVELLQMSFLRADAEIKRDFEMAQYFETREFNARRRLIEQIEDRLPSRIGFGLVKETNGK